MRAAAPSVGRMGTSSTASPRTRPRFPGALKTPPVSRASYTILRRPPTTHDDVYSTQPTEERSNRGDRQPCAGDGESPTSTTGHPADRRGTAFRARGGQPRGVRGGLMRKDYSVAEGRYHKSVEQDYEEEDWDTECPLSNDSTVVDGSDHKIATKKEPKKVRWEEGDRLTTVFPVPRRINPRKMVSEKGQKAGDWNQECRPAAESSLESQKNKLTMSPEEAQNEEERQREQMPLTIESPAAKQCDRETMVTERDWKPECVSSTERSAVTEKEPETVVTEEQQKKDSFEQQAPSKSLCAAATQTNQETSGSDEEDSYWDDDEDDLSADEPTVIIRTEPRPEEEWTTMHSLEQQAPVASASTASTQMDLVAVPTGTNEYSRQEWLSSTESAMLIGSGPGTALAHIDGREQYWEEQGPFVAGSPASKQGVQDATAPVDQYGDEYPQEAGATAPSTVQMVPVVSYMFVPVVTYQPCTVEVPSATEIPLDSVPCDKLTEAQEVPKEDHWKEVCPSETYFSSALDSRNSVATSENEWWKEEGVEQLGQWTTDFTLASQLYHDSILPEDQRKEEDWEKQCQPLSDFTLASQAYTEAKVPEVQDNIWTQECQPLSDFTLASEAYSEAKVPEVQENIWKQEWQPLSDFTLAAQAYSEAKVPEVQDNWTQECQPLSDFTMASQAYTEAVDPVVQDNEWKQECQPLSDFTLSSQAYTEAKVSEVQDNIWKQEFPVQSSTATPTPFGAMPSEWQGEYEDWEPECTPTLAGESSVATNGYYGGAVTDGPTREEEDWCQGRPLATEFTATVEKVDRTTSSVEFTDEDWEQEIVPGQPGYVPHGSTFFQRMRHRSHRQRRRLYREQAVSYRLQEEERAKASGDDAPMQVAAGHRPSDGSGPSSQGLVPPVPPSASGTYQDGLEGRGSQPNPAAANRTDRRTMADVVRSPAPTRAQSTSSSQRPATVEAPCRAAAAGDQAGVQVAPEDETWEIAAFLQAAWTVVAGADGCLFYESKRNTGGPLP